MTTKPDPFTCPDCGHTAPLLLGGLISMHEPDCPNVAEEDEIDDDFPGDDIDDDPSEEDWP